MMYISIFEVIYSILDFSTVPEIFSKDSAFLIVIDKNSTILPDILLVCALVAFCSLFGMSMAIFAIHFVYRFLVITGHLHLTEVSYMGPLFLFETEKGTYTPNFDAFVTIAFMTLLIGLSFTTVFYCGYRIYKKMESLTMLRSSGIDRSLQSQLFWALVFQTLIPVVLMHIPASFGFVFSMFGISMEIFGELPTITVFIYPALDPLPNFFIIKNFRQAIFEFLGCGKKKETSTSCNENNPIQRESLEMQRRNVFVVESN
ncbi:hypothetical protein L5515_003867 [Caenorhabditis briggsae]|uniref:Seven TM Receptor n=1 Tax=Caenorhabditis briggsae TaxID=6238 RepID=A0AAE9JC76_CAEBR|nr:hypothetical protein L5515_003867 [Caenorhabditis briggsae]